MPPKKKSASAIDKARETFATSFEKTYGKGTIDRSGRKKSSYEVIPTGSIDLDFKMGCGGYVLGRITEVWGQEGVGKTTFVVQGAREAQAKHPDKLVLWIDMEGTFDRAWAVTQGLDVSRQAFWLVTPNSAEEVADQMKDALRSGLFSMVILDSIGAMIPEAEKEKDADEAVVANQAKIVTRMVKIGAVEARKSSTAVVLINQVRANISSSGRGAATTTSGGFALKHCTTHKFALSLGGSRLTTTIDGEQRQVGHPVAVKVERNKVAPPLRRAEFTLIHTRSNRYGDPGIDKADDAATVGLNAKVIEQTGGWYTLPNGKKYNGRDSMVLGLRANPEWVDEVREAVLATLEADDDTPVLAEADKDLDKIESEVPEGVDAETGEVVAGSKFAKLSETEGTGLYEQDDWVEEKQG